MSKAPMMQETITPRVVAVCDAVDRSCVSPSSRASIFEVLRDSQILGSDKMKKVPKNAPEPDSTFNWRLGNHDVW